LEKKIGKGLPFGPYSRLCGEFDVQIKKFSIFSRGSRLLRESPKYAVLTTRGKIFIPLGDAHSYLKVELQITKKVMRNE
jgi:hypothetical protein